MQDSDGSVTAHLKPVDYQIRFYLDSYRVQLIAHQLAAKSRQLLNDVIGLGGDDEIRDNLDLQVTPEKLAKLIGDALWTVERRIVAGLEAHLRTSGHAIVSETDRRLASLDRSMLPSFVRTPRKPIEGDTYVRIASRGTTFAPRPLDMKAEIRRLEGLASREPDERRRGWLQDNIRSLADGRLTRRDGEPVDLAFSQAFVDHLAAGLGDASHGGRHRIWWGEGRWLQEKGVDADLIVTAMDDLHRGDVDAFIFFTNDSDFAPLFKRIKDEGKAVLLCASERNVARELVRMVGGEDGVFYLDSPDLLSDFPEVWLKDRSFTAQLALDAVMQRWRSLR